MEQSVSWKDDGETVGLASWWGRQLSGLSHMIGWETEGVGQTNGRTFSGCGRRLQMMGHVGSGQGRLLGDGGHGRLEELKLA